MSVGYHFGSQSVSAPTIKPPTSGIEVQGTEENSEDEDEEIADGDLSAIQAGFLEQCKLVSITLYTLKMRPRLYAAVT